MSPDVAAPLDEPTDGLDQPMWRSVLIVRWSVPLAMAGAVGGALSGASPTGWAAADIFWAGLLAGSVAIAASRVAPIALIALFGATLGLAVGDTTAVLLAGAALLAAGLGFALPPEHRRRSAGAASGALAANAMLRLPEMGPTGTSALLVAVLVASVVFLSWRSTPPETRRPIVVWVGRGAAVLVGVVVVSGVVMVGIRGTVNDGVDAALQGADRARAGDIDRARGHLDVASARMRTASRWLDSPLVFPARAVPLLGPQVRAVSAMTGDAARLANAGRNAIAVVDDGGFAVIDGAVDLQTVADAIEPLEESVAALERIQHTMATVDSPWLLPLITNRLDELVADVEPNLPAARRALTGARLASGFLGAEHPRRYLVVFTTPAESRFMGGFVAHYAEIVVDEGRIDIAASGHPEDFHTDRSDLELIGLDEHMERHANYSPPYFLENVTVTPDGPRAAELARQIHQRETGESVDAVVIMDTAAIAALGTLNAPIDLERVGVLDQDEVERFLLFDQYTQFPDEDEQRAVLDELIEDTIDGLFDGELNVSGLIERLGPLVEQGRLQVISFDAEENEFLLDVGLTRPFHQPGGIELLAVRSANASPNKLDAYLERHIDHQVVVDPDRGSLTVTTRVELVNAAPPGLQGVVSGGWDLPVPGTNRQYVSIYTAHSVESLTVDGGEVEPWSQTELGWNVASVFVDLLRGQRTTIEMTFSGVYDPSVDELVISYQPTVIPDRVSARVVATDGTVLATYEGSPTAEVRIRYRGMEMPPSRRPLGEARHRR